MSLHELLSSPVMHRLGWTLLHSLWQAAAVAVLLGVIVLLMRRRSPQARYLAAVGALTAVLTMSVLTFCHVSPPLPASQAQAPAAVQEFGPETPPAAAIGPRERGTGGPPAVPSETADLPPAAAHPAAVASAAPAPHPWVARAQQALQPYLPHLVSAWLLGVLALSLWRTGGWIAAVRLRVIGTQPVALHIQSLAQRLAGRLGLRRPIRILQSLVVQTPMVIGWLRPVVLLPLSAVTGLAPAQLEAILAHELAHIQRYDYLANLIQTVVETLFFYHPAVWWISRCLRLERERCCDDVAVEACGDRIHYAEALAAVEEVRGAAPAAPAARRARVAVGASGGSGKELIDRIGRVIGVQQGESSSARWLAGVLVLACLAVAGVIIYGCGADTAGTTATSSLPATAPATKSADPASVARDYSQRIARVLPRGWSAMQTGAAVTVRRDQPVKFIHYQVNGPPPVAGKADPALEEAVDEGTTSAPAPVSEPTPPATSSAPTLLESNPPKSYEIVLTFGPQVSAEQFRQLIAADRAAKREIDTARTKLRNLTNKFDEYIPHTDEDKRLLADYRALQARYRPLPDLYADDYAVTLHRPQEFLSVIADPGVGQEIEKVLEGVQGLMSFAPDGVPKGVEELKADVDSLQVAISAHRMDSRPEDDIDLRTFKRPEWDRTTLVTKDQMLRLIDAMSQAGILREAVNLHDHYDQDPPLPFVGVYFTTSDRTGGGIWWAAKIGWDAATYRKVQAVRDALEGPARASADKLLQRLDALRPATQPATKPALLTDQEASDKFLEALTARMPADWTVKVERGKVEPVYWPDGNGVFYHLVLKKDANEASIRQGGKLWIMDRGYAAVETPAVPGAQTWPASELPAWRGRRVFEHALGPAQTWPTMTADVQAALKAADAPDANQPATAPATRAATAPGTIALSAEVDGQVKSLDVQSGQRVVKGQLLATLDSQDLRMSIAQAQAQSEARRKMAAAAAKKLADGEGSAAEAAAAADKAAQAAARLDQLKAELPKCEIRSPLDGTVTGPAHSSLGMMVRRGDRLFVVTPAPATRAAALGEAEKTEIAKEVSGALAKAVQEHAAAGKALERLKPGERAPLSEFKDFQSLGAGWWNAEQQTQVLISRSAAMEDLTQKCTGLADKGSRDRTAAYAAAAGSHLGDKDAALRGAACEFLTFFPQEAVEADLTQAIAALLEDAAVAFEGASVSIPQRAGGESIARVEGGVKVSMLADQALARMTTFHFADRAAFDAWWKNNQGYRNRLWYWSLRWRSVTAQNDQAARDDLAALPPTEALRLMLLAGNSPAKVADAGLTPDSEQTSDKPAAVKETQPYTPVLDPKTVSDFVRRHSFKDLLLRTFREDIPWPEARAPRAVRGLWYAIWPVLPPVLEKADEPEIEKMLASPRGVLADPAGAEVRAFLAQTAAALEPARAEPILLGQLKWNPHQPLLAAQLVLATGRKHWGVVQAACPELSDKDPVIAALARLGTPQAAAALAEWLAAINWTPKPEDIEKYGYETDSTKQFLLEEFIKAAAALNGGKPVIDAKLQDRARGRAAKGWNNEEIRAANKDMPAARAEIVAALGKFFTTAAAARP